MYRSKQLAQGRDIASGIFPLFERLLREELEGKEGALREVKGESPEAVRWIPRSCHLLLSF